jgi:hypothetical protein
MEGMMGLVNETVHAFHSEYNFGKDSAKGLMPYCRPAVEKFIFSKVRQSINLTPNLIVVRQAVCNVCNQERGLRQTFC